MVAGVVILVIIELILVTVELDDISSLPHRRAAAIESLELTRLPRSAAAIPEEAREEEAASALLLTGRVSDVLEMILVVLTPGLAGLLSVLSTLVSEEL